METLQEIVFVDPFDQEVIVVRRTEQADVWIETAYSSPDQLINMDGFQILVSEIFANLPKEE